ncbi:MAG: metallophosphoesterase [Phycisphaerales bacterium]|nr:metallophosphoesterase [Phycisphaerales bacterium]
MMQSGDPSRRQLLQGLGAAAVLSALPWKAGAQPAQAPAPQGRKRSLRLAHMTDMHIQPERNAVAGVAACLQHAQSLKDPPAMILTGGDHVMDAFDEPFDRADLQWKLLCKTFKDENSLPVHYCLGNHDIWGWNKPKSKTVGTEAGWGKTMSLDRLEMKKPYYAIDAGGWHLVVLDSVRTDPDDPSGYVGGLDDEQFEWLKADLAAHSAANTLMLTHIPILSVSVLDAKTAKGGDMKVGGGVIFTDWPRIKGLFAANPQVKCVISGHMHRIDRCEFRGVTHLCNGAVCGNWWKGKHHETAEGYALVDLFDDGSVERTYVEYGWKAEK